MVHVGSLIALIVFYLIILIIGIIAAWKKTRRKTGQEASETFIVANRDINFLLGFFTMTAVYVGGGYINGITEIIYTSGIIWAQAPIGYSISGIIGGLFFAKPMRGNRYVTLLDPFQQKYGLKVGGLLFIPALVGEIFWASAILASLGSALEVIMELDFRIAVIISGTVAVFYTFFGGQYSMCYTDAAQLILITFGLLLCTPFAWHSQYVSWNGDGGSIAVNSTFKNETHDWIGHINPEQIPRYIDEYLLLICGGIPWQDYFLRILSAKSIRNAQIVSVSATCLILIFGIPPAILGYLAVHTDFDSAGFNSTELRQNSQLVLPVVLQYLTPQFVAFCGLGAVAAGVMSSTDAAVLAGSSMFSHNIYRNIFRPNASDKENVWVMRIGFLVTGALACLLAIINKSVYAMFVFCSDFVYVMLFPPLVCVLFIPFVNSFGVVSGCIVGLLLRLLGGEELLFIPPVLKYPYFNYKANKQMFPFKTFAMLSNFIVTCVVSVAVTMIFKKWPKLAKYQIHPAESVKPPPSLTCIECKTIVQNT